MGSPEIIALWTRLGPQYQIPINFVAVRYLGKKELSTIEILLIIVIFSAKTINLIYLILRTTVPDAL